MLNKDYH